MHSHSTTVEIHLCSWPYMWNAVLHAQLACHCYRVVFNSDMILRILSINFIISSNVPIPLPLINRPIIFVTYRYSSRVQTRVQSRIKQSCNWSLVKLLLVSCNESNVWSGTLGLSQFTVSCCMSSCSSLASVYFIISKNLMPNCAINKAVGWSYLDIVL